MALRVLLADESSAIKKVFQLALQDFAVEVVAVNVGIDVEAVARQFHPDIIFADVLLQKLSGYEVCSKLKEDPELSKIPVVLIWSGFMELDEDKFQACGADAHLEKPFEASQLRQIIEKLVTKTKTQKLSDYLELPEIKPDLETSPKTQSSISPSTPLSAPEKDAAGEEFLELHLPEHAPSTPSLSKSSHNEEDLDLDLINESEEEGHEEGFWTSQSLNALSSEGQLQHNSSPNRTPFPEPANTSLPSLEEQSSQPEPSPISLDKTPSVEEPLIKTTELSPPLVENPPPS
ncbi:MAG: response regulator, partial [Bdellovibrio sp.]